MRKLQLCIGGKPVYTKVDYSVNGHAPYITFFKDQEFQFAGEAFSLDRGILVKYNVTTSEAMLDSIIEQYNRQTSVYGRWAKV